MFSIKKLATLFLTATLFVASISCSDDDDTSATSGDYVVAVAVEGPAGVFTYYVIAAPDLVNGKITPVNNGVEQTGYRDFAEAENKIFSIGGLGEVTVNMLERDAAGAFVQSGTAVAEQALNGIIQVDSKTLLAASFSTDAAVGNEAKFHTIDIPTGKITNTVSRPLEELSQERSWPRYSGMELNNNKLFVSFYLNDVDYPWNNDYTDQAEVAVYSYPALELEKIITSDKTGPVGGFNVQCGIIKVESGDLYAYSASNSSNGFTQKTKSGGILKINKGATEFDSEYFLPIEGISHIIYAGGDLALVEINTLPFAEQTRWADAPLKTAIVNLKTQQVTDVSGIPSHTGEGGRSFGALTHDGKVYLTTRTDEGIFIYQVDPSTATAVKGAQVEGAFIAGIYHID